MLQMAIKAGLPLVAVRTRDLVNFGALLKHLTGLEPMEVRGGRPDKLDGYDRNGRSIHTRGSVFWTAEQVKAEHAPDLYDRLVEFDTSFVAVNQESLPPEFFDAGDMPVPRDFLYRQLNEADVPQNVVQRILPGLGGLTLKEVGELVRICQVRHGDLSLAHVLDVRRRCFGSSRGLHLVDAALPYYLPDAQLDAYLAWAKPFLLGDHDPRLRPRGLMLAGPPGVGKTTAAKHAATTIGVPLYRLDLGAIKGKWVGESEHAMGEALARVDREAPCVLLVDEVEKLFGRDHDEGVTQNLLASLLWWLAEHDSRVLAVLTTNGLGDLPPELWRQGRLDRVLPLCGLARKPALEFARGLAATFFDGEGLEDEEDRQLQQILEEEFGADYDVLPHAQVAEVVKGLVRDWTL